MVAGLKGVFCYSPECDFFFFFSPILASWVPTSCVSWSVVDLCKPLVSFSCGPSPAGISPGVQLISNRGTQYLVTANAAAS